MARMSKTDAEQLLGGRHNLTETIVEHARCQPGQGQTIFRDTDVVGLGLRVTAGGVKTFIFEAKHNGRAVRMKIGRTSAWKLEAAREKARALRVSMDGGVNPLEQERQRKALAKAEAAAAEQAARYTVAGLCREYIEHLKKAGRSSWGKAEGIFELHITPTVAAIPAKDLQPEQVASMLRRLEKVGKQRTAGKLRSYLHSAYATAQRAKLDSRVSESFAEFGIISNPVSPTVAHKAGTDKNPLTLDEVRAYWARIQDDTFEAAALRLHVLLAGQRVEQLMRVGVADVLEDRIRLVELKGRKAPDEPYRTPDGKQVLVRRLHYLPLTKAAAQAIADLRRHADHAKGFLISRDGQSPCTANALAKWGKALAGDAVEGFTVKRIRSAAETTLAAAGVSPHIRAQLLSHGLNSLQAAHYDGHDYMQEKLLALTKWHRLVVGAEQLKTEPQEAEIIDFQAHRVGQRGG